MNVPKIGISRLVTSGDVLGQLLGTLNNDYGVRELQLWF
jgi:hypothetical protein